MNSCRLCSKAAKGKATKLTEANRTTLSETFKITLSSDEALPQSVCRTCTTKLTTAHSFCKQIEKVQRSLEEQLAPACRPYEEQLLECNRVEIKIEKFEPESSIKEEPADDFFDTIYRSEEEREAEPVAAKKPRKPTQRKKKKKKKAPKKKSATVPAQPPKNSIAFIYKDELCGTFTDAISRLATAAPADIVPDTNCLTDAAQTRHAAIQWRSLTYTCTVPPCTETFASIFALDAHLKSHHQRRYRSVCCGIQCCNAASFATHVIKYHTPDARFSCLLCSQVFASTLDLFRHARAHDSPELRAIFFCLYCGFHYNTAATLARHLLCRHKRVDTRPRLVCDFCGFVSRERDSMVGHMFSHMQSTRQVCETCGAIFKRRGELQSHFASVHGANGGATKVQCGSCGKTFNTELRLRKHRRNVHEKHLLAHDFACDVCGKRFRTAYMMRTHALSHDPDASRYTCKYCGKGFRYTSGYQYHVRSAHTNEKPYACPACDLKFFDYANAQKHTRGVHGDGVRPVRVG